MQQLSVQVFMHVPFEGPGGISQWIETNGHKVNYTKFFEDFTLPGLSDFDLLVIMGGPMSVYEEHLHPWLKTEKAFIKTAIEAGKTIIGICLGSQLLAEVLGARVYPNAVKEIGWFPIKKTESALEHPITASLPEETIVFHWHGDTYDLPPATTHLFYSDHCKHQAFIYDNRVIGLQFHFEVNEKSMDDMIVNGRNELLPCPTIQSEEVIRTNTQYIPDNNKKIFSILDGLTAKL